LVVGNSSIGSTAYPPGTAPRRVKGLDFANEKDFIAVLIDSAHGFGYLASEHGVVVKVRLSDFTRVGVLSLNTGDNSITCAVIDPTRGYVYCVAHGWGVTPGRVVKVRLSDFTCVGELPFDAGEPYAYCAVIDPLGGFAYFGITASYATYTTPGKVVKVRLLDFKRVGALTLHADETEVNAAAIDLAGGHAYFGANGKVVKVRLSDFTRVATMLLGSACQTMLIAPTGVLGYFGAIRVRLADLTITGKLNSYYGSDGNAVAMDPAGRYVYFGIYDTARFTSWGKVIKVRLSDGKYMGELALKDEVNKLYCAAIDSAGEYAYFADKRYPDSHGKTIKVALSCKNAIHASKIYFNGRGAVRDVRFYSHAAKGNLRLAIYSEATTKTLLWQSGAVANTKAGGWLTVPLTQGTPATLTLNPGQYWLAWQTDSNDDVASDASGDNAWDSFVVNQPFGPFPARLGAAAITLTCEKWSEYLTYDRLNAASGWQTYP
jgi:hypothetical protein